LSVTRLSLRSEGETSIECSNFVPTIFLLFQAHLYLDHISKEEKQKYMNKMQALGTCDPYTEPAAVFQSLKTAGHSKTLNMKNN